MKLKITIKCLHFIMRVSALYLIIVLTGSMQLIMAHNTIGQGLDKITVTIEMNGESLTTLFTRINRSTGLQFSYPSDEVNKLDAITLSKDRRTVKELLDEVFKNTSLSYRLVDEKRVLIYLTDKKEKEKSPLLPIVRRWNAMMQVSGKVTSHDGESLPGVNVVEKGTTNGTVTDIDGNYKLDVIEDGVLIFSFIGYKTQEVSVNGRSTIDLLLEEDISKLNEVVINAGYYNVSERESTGNIARISDKVIEKQPVNNPLAAMQGHMAGVNIRQTSGVPGSGFEIDIRGKNFINGATDPLFIIDGVPYSSESLEVGDLGASINGANVSPLNAINPLDITSIEVLKDADATAIYGSRGANGVVLITTKKGKEGKTKVSVNISRTLGQVTRFNKLMNTEQYLELRVEGINNDGYGPYLDNPAFDYVWPDLKTWDQNRYTDWQEVLIGSTAYRNNAQLSISGGNENTQFLFSAGYQGETTVFPGDANYTKAFGRTNISHQSKEGRFKLTVSTNYTIEDNQLPLADFTNLANTLEPNAPALYDEAGNLNWENNTFDNPLATLERAYRAQINTIITNTVLSYQIHPNLELKTSLGYNNYQFGSYVTWPYTAFNPAKGYDASRSSFSTNSSNRHSWIVEPQLNWQQQVGDIHLNVLIGSTFQKQGSQQYSQRGTGYTSNQLLFSISAAKTLEALQDTDSEYNYQAFFGRLNFSWKDIYILNLTGRRDGSSRFGPGNQFGNFGAIGAAWLFSEETFLKDNSILSFGKFRGSYGITGSDNIGDYRFLDTYSTTGFDYNGITTLEPKGVFNPNYSWEENRKLELALELGLFKDRISLNTAWYQNRSANQLIGIPLPVTTGFTSLTDNFDATVENTGFEIDINTTNFQKEHFKWTTTFNLTVPKNKLLKFPGLASSTFANRYRIGQPLTAIPVYHAFGVDPNTGLYTFEDYNDDGSITSLCDRQLFVDFAPKFYGGLGNTITYKNVSLDFFFQFKKQRGYNTLHTSSSVAGIRGNRSVNLVNRWQEAGDISPIQIASALGRVPGASAAGQIQSESNAAISDASFIRLRNITLAYKLPNIESLGMEVNLYLQGQNLLTLTDYDGADPEQPYSHVLPPLQQITLGLQIGF